MNITMDNLLFYILLAFLSYIFFFEKKSEGFEAKPRRIDLLEK